MPTESVKVCLLPSTLTYYERHLTGQNAVAYTITSNLLPLALHQNLYASLHIKTSLPLNIRTKKIKDSFAWILPSHITAAFQNWALVTKKNGIPPWLRPQIPPLMEWAPKGQSVWGKHQCLLLPILWVLHLPSHLPQKHHALSNKTRHQLCCCQHRENSDIYVPPFME